MQFQLMRKKKAASNIMIAEKKEESAPRKVQIKRALTNRQKKEDLFSIALKEFEDDGRSAALRKQTPAFLIHQYERGEEGSSEMEKLYKRMSTYKSHFG